MSWKKELFKNFKLYAVTDLRTDARIELDKIDAVYAGGADIVQLRSKTLSDFQLFQMGLKIRALASKRKKLFFVNDRPDLALALQADGVHIGQEDLPVAVVRKMAQKAGHALWIGKSTHHPAQARAALKERPDYIGVGPVFATPTKPGYRPAGLDYVRKVAAMKLKIPFVAIGGIDLTNVEMVFQAGARRVAVVRALFNTGDAYDAAKKFRERIEAYE